MKTSEQLTITDEQRDTLPAWLSAHGTAQQVVLRCNIVLGVAAGGSVSDVAARLGTTRTTVRLWRDRFEDGGPAALRRIL